MSKIIENDEFIEVPQKPKRIRKTKFFRVAQDVSVEKATNRVRVKTVFKRPSMTQTQFQQATDVNNIVKRYEKVPDPSIFEVNDLGFRDFKSQDDFHTTMNKISKATQDFMELPASLRKRFSNDPGALFEFMNDPKNDAEAISLGLKVKKENKPSDTDRIVGALEKVEKQLTGRKKDSQE